MKTNRYDATARSAVALTVAATLALPSFGGVLDAATLQAPQSASAAAAVSDGGWPRAYTTRSGGRVRIYQPQIASWEHQQHLVAYAAVAYLAKGTDKPVLGTIRVEADTKVALERRLVNFAAFKITETNFGSLGRQQARELVAEIDEAIPDGERVMALDYVLAGLDTSQIVPKNVEGVKADPPTVFCSTKPAVLVNLDGDPIWSPIKDSDLKYAVNTTHGRVRRDTAGCRRLRQLGRHARAARRRLGAHRTRDQ